MKGEWKGSEGGVKRECRGSDVREEGVKGEVKGSEEGVKEE